MLGRESSAGQEDSHARRAACLAGIYNGGLLPPVFYVPGVNSSAAANRSLTFNNVTILYDSCVSEAWHNVTRAISAQLQVTCRASRSFVMQPQRYA